MKSKKQNSLDWILVVLVIVSIIPLIGLFFPGLPITHDGKDHVARIANFYQSLSEGVLIPRWAENLNWGYGHPILMFLYPLPSYSSSLIHFLGFSFVDSVKLFFGLAFIASGLTMYLWLREFLSKEGAFVGAILYIYAPYRFVDLYVRGAIGEHAAFVFPPLVLYFLYKLSHKTSYWYLLGGSLSLAGLILAHNAISLMFLPVIFLYIFYLVWNSKRRKSLILNSLFLILFGFALSAFFWTPALLEGKYTLRDKVTEDSVSGRFAFPLQLLYGPWSYGGTGQLSVQVGVIQWLLIIVSIPLLFVRKLRKDTNRTLLLVSLLLLFLSLFLITSYSEFVWNNISTLQKFQFPWRFLSLSTFLAAVIGAIVYSNIFSRHSARKPFLSPITYTLAPILFVILILLTNMTYWHAKGYLDKPESFYTGIYDSTTDTGESAPIWSVRFMEKRAKAHMEVYDGVASITELERKSTYHKYSVTASKRTLFRENTLFFPGWKVLVDGVEVPIEYQSQDNRGIMTFFIEKGKHEVLVKFEETKLRTVANWISLGSLLALIGWGILKLRSKR
jgi:uncharacterized membrane protein